MLLSLSTGTLYVYPLRTVMRWARQTGFDGVEVSINPEAILRGGRAVQRLAEEEGTRILSVHPAVAPIPGWRQRHGGLQRSIALAQQTGAGLVVIHVPRSESLDEGQGLELRGVIEEWQRQPAGTGLRLAIENKAVRNPAELRYALTPLNRLRAFADEYDLALVLDTCHAGLAGEELVRARELFGERLANVHFSDMGLPPRFPLLGPVRGSFQEHRPPGAGTLPLKPFLARLAGDGYAGLLTLEVNPLPMRFWWPPEARRRLVSTVSWIRDVTRKA